jgi:hypothetical protein
MRRKIVSEKTLELNLCATMLAAIRSWPGCGDAFWIGMKQYQEARSGIDELLANMPSAHHLALQFKAPSSQHLDSEPYVFGLGEDQNARLQRLAESRPGAVYYVLPHYNTFARMRQDAPNLDAHTYLLKVVDTRPLQCKIGGSSRRHRVESFETPPHAVMHSEPVEAPLWRLDRLLRAEGERLRESWLSNSDLAGWLREVAIVPSDRPAATGQRLRGFATVCVPRS